MRLSDFRVELKAGVEYEWSVSLVVDPERRAEDVVSMGYIRRVERPELAGASRPGARRYAELGLWYDALAAVSDAIDAAPDDRALIGQRDALLRQAGLDSAIEG